LVSVGAAMLAISSLTACAFMSGGVVARVADMAMTISALDHRMGVMAGGQPVGAVERRDPRLKQQALEYLIASSWVTGEAAERGLAPSSEEIRERLREGQAASFAGGEAELRAFLQATRQTTSDLALEARVELAAGKLTALALKAAPSVTGDQALGYYRSHEERYVLASRREVRITNTKTAAAAAAIESRVAAGEPFAAVSSREMVTLPRRPGEAYARPALEEAIARASADVLVGPVKGRVDYYLFEVKRVLPATRQPFARVEGSIRAQLAAEAQRRALASFIARWRSRWRARTDCTRGYVVQKCRQYDGVVSPEDALDFK